MTYTPQVTTLSLTSSELHKVKFHRPRLQSVNLSKLNRLNIQFSKNACKLIAYVSYYILGFNFCQALLKKTFKKILTLDIIRG